MKIDKFMRDKTRKFLILLMRENGKNLSDITTMKQAWEYADSLRLRQELAHWDRDITDKHIETLLKRVFPYITQ